MATHGKPSEANAHPHTSCSGDIAVVHNGIIENFAELREELVGRGHVFKSETDTEVVAHLVEESYHRMLAEGTGDLRAAVAEAAARLVGAYGLAVMADAEPARSSPAARIPPSWWAAARPAATWPPTSLR